MLSIFSYLNPNPLENHFTRGLAFLIHPEREFGPDYLEFLFRRLPALERWNSHGFASRFQFDDYKVTNQDKTGTGQIFDITIESPAQYPKVKVILENKVEAKIEDRPEQVREYVKQTGMRNGLATYLILNTRDPVSASASLPDSPYFTQMRWYQIANLLDDYLALSREDVLANHFRMFLSENGMGDLPRLGKDDLSVFPKMGYTNAKIDRILEEVKQRLPSFESDTDDARRPVDDDPIYGLNFWKRSWAVGENTGGYKYFCLWTGFGFHTHGKLTRWCFVTQMWMDERFEGFMRRNKKLAASLEKATSRVSGCQYDEEFVYNVCVDLEEMLGDHRKFDEQMDEIVSKSVSSVQQFEKYLVPVLKEGARKADI